MHRACARVLAVLAFTGALGRAASGGTLQGVVRDPKGRPVAGALVAAMGVRGVPAREAMRPAGLARSGADGGFRIEGLAAGTYAATATAPRFAAAYRGDVKIGIDATSIDLALGDGGITISGLVRDETGRATAAHVRAARVSELEGDVFHADADADGRYAMILPDASYLLLAEAEPRRSIEVDASGHGDRTCDLVVEPVARGAAPAEVTEWIRSRAIRIEGADPGRGLADLQPLAAVVGDARVVALGEATHGTREFFQLKHRWLEFLATRMDFTVFAIEASLPDALAVNDYVLDGKGDPAAALAGLGFWTWDTQEVLEMIRWMRRWNEDPSHARKLEFWGFDMQNPSASVAWLVAWLERVDPQYVAEARTALAPFADRAMPGRWATAAEAERAPALAALDAVGRWLDERKAQLIAASSERDWQIASRQVVLLRQADDLFRSGSGGGATRDVAMAANVRWIADVHPAGTKLVLWAHNGHVDAQPSPAGGPMGAELRRALGGGLVVVGFAFDQGAFQARQMPFGPASELRPFAVGPARAESLDAALATAGFPMFALDLRQAPRAGPVAEWLRLRRPARSIGAGFADDLEASFFVPIVPPRSFDVVVFVAKTNAARPNRPSPQAAYRDAIGASLPAAPAASNLDVEECDSGERPVGWILPKACAAEGYEIAAPEGGAKSGRRSLRLSHHAAGVASVGFGDALQIVDAAPFRGKKVRLRASLRAEGGRAQLWLRVDCKSGKGFFDNMKDRPVTSSTWTEVDITGEVAEDATSLGFGLLLAGDGTAWLDAASLEKVE
jgi:erythromycin esterase